MTSLQEMGKRTDDKSCDLGSISVQIEMEREADWSNIVIFLMLSFMDVSLILCLSKSLNVMYLTTSVSQTMEVFNLDAKKSTATMVLIKKFTITVL